VRALCVRIILTFDYFRSSDAVSCKAENRLLAKLFTKNGYHKWARPVERVNETAIIELGLVVEKIVELVGIIQLQYLS